MHQTKQTEFWNPCEDLFSNLESTNYALVILNTCFKFHPNFLFNLWNHAKVRHLVDGGTERWLSWLKLHDINYNAATPPDLITGDMDSLSQDILNYFINNELCKVIRTPDQNETDFTKALRELHTYCCEENCEIDVVYVIADTCGRFDQILANINSLYKAPSILGNTKVFQVASNSITWLLFEGSHIIEVPLKLRADHEWCALIPIGSPSKVSTSGLKWNLDKSKLEFGGLVSTSNTYDDASSQVAISTNNSIIWSMGIEPLLLFE